MKSPANPLRPTASGSGSLRLTVVGAGAVGSEVCRLLAEASYQSVLIIDPDQLEPRNIAMSGFYQDIVAELGGHALSVSKSLLVAQSVDRRCGLKWESRCMEIADVGLQRLAESDVILCCADSALARVETAYAAHVARIPMLDAGVQSDGVPAGRTSWFAPHPTAACYLCGRSEDARAEYLAYATSSALGCQPLPEESHINSTPQVITAVAQALLMLLEGSPQPQSSWATNHRLTSSGWASETIHLPQSRTCPWNEDRPGAWLPVDDDSPLQDALTDPGLCIELLWPCCLQARCTVCDHRYQPRQRVARVRRNAICEHCRAVGTIEPIETIYSIRAGDPAALYTPRQLGFPEQHLYFFRPTFVA